MSHFRQQIYSSKNPTISGEVIASAGVDQSGYTWDTITLDATGSSSTQGSVNSYLWTQVSGWNVSINNPTGATTTIKGSGLVGTYVFTVRVGDDLGNYDTDSTNVTIQVTPTLTISSSVADENGDGYLYFNYGEPNEVLNLQFDLFNANNPDAITFTGSIMYSILNYLNTQSLGTITLDSNGEATEQYNGSGNGIFTCQVKIKGRDIGSMPVTYGTTAILVTLS